MRNCDGSGMDPEVIAELDAIDATLAGEPVDPVHAELAELALLLADTAPRPTPEFASDLDRRVARRFEPVRSGGAKQGSAPGKRRLLSVWTAGPAVALVAGAAVAVVLVGGAGGGGNTLGRPALNTVANSISAPASPTSRQTTYSSHIPATTGSGISAVATTTTAGAAATSYAGARGVPASPPAALVAPTPVPGTTGKVIQSASISLTTPNAHVDQVSQEVYNVVSQQSGTVTSSQITAATQGNGGGYASFTLSFPTANLQAAMNALSRLPYAAVASRTDGTQNVGGQYNTDQQSLQQAQALRTSLLKQLAAADSQTAIDAIEAQLKTANAQIASAESTLGSLQHKISHSTVTVQINTGGIVFTNPIAVNRGFTIGRAGHDAVRVLVVSVGVALIALAVLVPVGLIFALLAWTAVILRGRRRERALDAG